MTLITNQHRYY